jgi:hypothetical protein
MANELTMSEEQNLQEQRGQLIEESVSQQEEIVGQTSKFASVLDTAKSDLTGKITETASGIKSSAVKTIKNIPDMAMAGLDPGVGMALKGAIGAGKGAIQGAKYAKGLFTGGRQEENKGESGSGTSQAVQQNLQQQDNQSDELSKIRDNTAGIKTEVTNLAAILKGDRLDKLEQRREGERQDDQILTALQSIEVGAGAEAVGGGEDDEGIGGIFSNLKDKLLGAVGAFAGLKATMAVFKSRVSNTGKAVANAGKRVAQTGRAAVSGTARAGRTTASTAGRAAQTFRGTAAGRQAGAAARRIASGSRAAIGGGGRGSAQAARSATSAGGSAASSGGAGRMAAAAVKYPKLLKFAKFIRGVPGLAPLAAGVEGILVATDDEMPPEEKKKELARILGGALGGAGGAKLGGILGSLALPGIGTIAGALAGGVGGYFLGGAISKKIAGALLESPSNESTPLPGTEPSSDNVPRGGAGPIGGSSTPSAGRMSRNRSQDIDKARSDRSAAESSGRISSGNNGGGNMNISNNVQNNRQAIIRNRPSAGSEPDNVSDTIMEAWAP